MSGGIRMTGLISNMDTETIVNKLMEAQKTKVTKIKNKQTKLEWTQDKWKDFNTKLYALYRDKTSELHLSSGYTTKKATSADEQIVKVTAENNATSGTHKVAVKQLASSQYVTSNKITISDFGKSTKLNTLGFTTGDIVTVKNGNKTIELNVNDSTTVNDFLTTCNKAGLSANYDTNQKRFFINSAGSGEENKFSITTSAISPTAYSAKVGIENLVDLSISNASTVNEALTILKEHANDPEPALGETSATESTETTLKNLAIEKTNLIAHQNVRRFYYDKAKKESALTADEITEIEDKYSDVADVTEREQKINDEKLSKLEQKIIAKMSTSDYQTAMADAELNGINSSKVMDELGETDASIIALYTFEDKTTRELTATNDMITAIEKFKDEYATGGSGDISYDASSSKLKFLGLGEIDGSTHAGDFTVVQAQDCIVDYNGTELVNKSNTISVNGITIEAINVSNVTERDSFGNPTKYAETSISVSNDVDAVYKKIKDFFTSYNSILKELNEAYNADSSRGCDPLTDEQKEVMTEDQIKKWEDKIKNSLLRRDDTIGSLTSAMKTALQSVVEIDGKKYSLATFGIMTAKDYTEKGLLHIYGDKEDATYSEEEDKLKKALQDDPDVVSKAFSGIIDNLHKTLIKKMEKTSISSALTFYNDVSIKNQINDYKDDVKTMEKKLDKMENNYYKQFTAMETALAKLQKQQSALSGLLGQ